MCSMMSSFFFLVTLVLCLKGEIVAYYSSTTTTPAPTVAEVPEFENYLSKIGNITAIALASAVKDLFVYVYETENAAMLRYWIKDLQNGVLYNEANPLDRKAKDFYDQYVEHGILLAEKGYTHEDARKYRFKKYSEHIKDVFGYSDDTDLSDEGYLNMFPEAAVCTGPTYVTCKAFYDFVYPILSVAGNFISSGAIMMEFGFQLDALVITWGNSVGLGIDLSDLSNVAIFYTSYLGLTFFETGLEGYVNIGWYTSFSDLAGTSQFVAATFTSTYVVDFGISSVFSGLNWIGANAAVEFGPSFEKFPVTAAIGAGVTIQFYTFNQSVEKSYNAYQLAGLALIGVLICAILAYYIKIWLCNSSNKKNVPQLEEYSPLLA